MYARSVEDELRLLFPKAGGIDVGARLDELMKKAVYQSTTHFGQSVPNPATVAGQFRMMLLELAAELGVQLSDARSPRLTARQYFS